MQQELYDILKEISAIQHARNRNWHAGQPASAMLEAAHQLELSALRHRLSASAPRVRESDPTPIQPETNSHRGGVFGWLGNLFRKTIP